MEQEETAMTIHIKLLRRMKQMVFDKKLDSDITEIITETLEGCIENAQSQLELEKTQFVKAFSKGGKWLDVMTGVDYFIQEYKQISK
jgi:hypothetical protein